MRYFFVCLAMFFFGLSEVFAQALCIIPQPAEMKQGSGMFVLSEKTKIVLKTDLIEAKKACDFFLEIINRSSGLDIDYAKSAKSAIRVEIDPSIGAPEGYSLNVTPQEVVVRAQTPTGIFYAFQTLRQLLPPETESRTVVPGIVWKIPAVEINDAPRFTYRGLMLDVARHFFPIEFLKRYIDLMAMYKYNRLHLHLTDDQGWRIEINAYPQLQNVGAWRRETMIGHLNDEPRRYDGIRYGGYYKQSELKDLVKYAAERHITIVPEIEMPGHATAALAAYPELACAGASYEVAREWGIFPNIYCPREETIAFLQTVLSEVMNIFPGKYIHIGGDECVKDQWSQSEYCKVLKLQNGLHSDEALQAWFIARIASYVKARGRTLVGWDEITEGGEIPEGATIMSWRGEQGGLTAARKGYDVIMTPHRFCYFDYYQWRNRNEEPLAQGGYLPMSMVYMYDPVPKELTDEQSKHILGAQGNLWTEYIATGRQAEYMTYPRACALSEVNWTPKELRSYNDFLTRLKKHSKRLDILSVNYAGHFMK